MLISEKKFSKLWGTFLLYLPKRRGSTHLQLKKKKRKEIRVNGETVQSEQSLGLVETMFAKHWRYFYTKKSQSRDNSRDVKGLLLWPCAFLVENLKLQEKAGHPDCINW